MRKGKLIVVDGTDGSGKTKQVEALLNRMISEGMPVQSISFPRYGTDTCEDVEAYLAKAWGPIESISPQRASEAYARDRLGALKRGELKPLEDGIHLLSNRYVASNMGHQGSKIADPAERTAFFRWNDELEHVKNGMPRPDINLILHVSPETAMKNIDTRGNAKDGHENLEHLRQAEATYLEIARSFPNFVLIECEERPGVMFEIPVIHEMVWRKVLPVLQAP